jgi:predicted RND superfamily exporter protein
LCLKRLSSIENLEESLKNAAKVEMSKLRKAQNDYKAKEKQMQQRIANKLFATKDKPSNSSSIRTISKPGDAEKNERRETELHEEKTNLGQSNDNDKVVGTAVSVPAKSKPSSSNNMVLLVATSFAVIIVSLIIAFSKK